MRSCTRPWHWTRHRYKAYMKGDSKATIVCPVEDAERQHGILMMIDL